MKVTLVIFNSAGERRSFNITRDMTVIGRREDCDLRIPLSDVSRKHCRVVKTDDGIKIEDLGSSNGTFLNGERVQEAAMNPGDTVTIGPVQFVLQVDGFPADEEISPNGHAQAAAPAADESLVEPELVEEPEISPDQPGTQEGGVEEFDPMSALGGSDSGLDMDGPMPGDSMKADLDGSDIDIKDT